MERIPKDFAKFLSDEELQATALQLDTAVSEIVDVGTQREAAYGDRAQLMKRVKELTTEIQLEESEAIMKIQGSGKDAFGYIGGTKIFLTNDTARDAYRREASRKQRVELAEVEGAVAEIEANLSKANDTFNVRVEALRGIQAKARLQAAMLEYLA